MTSLQQIMCIFFRTKISDGLRGGTRFDEGLTEACRKSNGHMSTFDSVKPHSRIPHGIWIELGVRGEVLTLSTSDTPY